MTRAVIVSALILAALSAALAVSPGEDGPVMGDAQARVRPLPPPPSWQAPPVDHFPEIVARPVFAPSRRPPAKAGTDAKPVVKFPDGRLVGVVVSDGTKVALVEDVSGKVVERLREGQTYGGWQVTGIGTAQVILRHLDLQHALELTKPGGAASPKGAGGRPAR